MKKQSISQEDLDRSVRAIRRFVEEINQRSQGISKEEEKMLHRLIEGKTKKGYPKF